METGGSYLNKTPGSHYKQLKKSAFRDRNYLKDISISRLNILKM
jgi:hypothetical protein